MQSPILILGIFKDFLESQQTPGVSDKQEGVRGNFWKAGESGRATTSK